MDKVTDKSTVNAATDMSRTQNEPDFWNQDRLSQVTRAPKDYDVSLGDMAKGIGAGALGIFEGAGYLIDKIPGVDIGLGDGISNLAGGGREALTNSMSIDAQQAMAAPLTQDGSPTSAFSDIDVWAMKIANGLGSVAGPMGSGLAFKGVTRALMKKGMSKEVSEEIAKRAIERTAGNVGMVGGTTTAIAGDLGSLGQQMHDETVNRSYSDLVDSPVWMEELAKIDADPQYADIDDAARMEIATERTAERAGMGAMTDPKAVAASIAGTLLGDTALMRPFLKKSTSTARYGVGQSAVAGGFREMPMEAMQEGTQAYIGNEVRNEILGDNVDPWEGVLDASIEGGAVGFATGGVVGAAGGAQNNAERKRILKDHKKLSTDQKAMYRNLPNDTETLKRWHDDAVNSGRNELANLIELKLYDDSYMDTTDIGKGDGSRAAQMQKEYARLKQQGHAGPQPGTNRTRHGYEQLTDAGKAIYDQLPNTPEELLATAEQLKAHGQHSVAPVVRAKIMDLHGGNQADTATAINHPLSEKEKGEQYRHDLSQRLNSGRQNLKRAVDQDTLSKATKTNNDEVEALFQQFEEGQITEDELAHKISELAGKSTSKNPEDIINNAQQRMKDSVRNRRLSRKPEQPEQSQPSFDERIAAYNQKKREVEQAEQDEQDKQYQLRAEKEAQTPSFDERIAAYNQKKREVEQAEQDEQDRQYQLRAEKEAAREEQRKLDQVKADDSAFTYGYGPDYENNKLEQDLEQAEKAEQYRQRSKLDELPPKPGPSATTRPFNHEQAKRWQQEQEQVKGSFDKRSSRHKLLDQGKKPIRDLAGRLNMSKSRHKRMKKRIIQLDKTESNRVLMSFQQHEKRLAALEKSKLEQAEREAGLPENIERRKSAEALFQEKMAEPEVKEFKKNLITSIMRVTRHLTPEKKAIVQAAVEQEINAIESDQELDDADFAEAMADIAEAMAELDEFDRRHSNATKDESLRDQEIDEIESDLEFRLEDANEDYLHSDLSESLASLDGKTEISEPKQQYISEREQQDLIDSLKPKEDAKPSGNTDLSQLDDLTKGIQRGLRRLSKLGDVPSNASESDAEMFLDHIHSLDTAIAEAEREGSTSAGTLTKLKTHSAELKSQLEQQGWTSRTPNIGTEYNKGSNIEFSDIVGDVVDGDSYLVIDKVHAPEIFKDGKHVRAAWVNLRQEPQSNITIDEALTVRDIPFSEREDHPRHKKYKKASFNIGADLMRLHLGKGKDPKILLNSPTLEHEWELFTFDELYHVISKQITGVQRDDILFNKHTIIHKGGLGEGKRSVLEEHKKEEQAKFAELDAYRTKLNARIRQLSNRKSDVYTTKKQIQDRIKPIHQEYLDSDLSPKQAFDEAMAKLDEFERRNLKPEVQPESTKPSEPRTHRYSKAVGQKANPGDTIFNSNGDRWKKRHGAENAITAAGLSGKAIATGSDIQGWFIDVINELPANTVLDVLEFKKMMSGLESLRHSIKAPAESGIDTKDLLNLALAFDSSARLLKDGSVEMNTFDINEMAKVKGLKLDMLNVSNDGKSSFDADVIKPTGKAVAHADWKGDLIKTRAFANELIDKGLLDGKAAEAVWDSNKLPALTNLVFSADHKQGDPDKPLSHMTKKGKVITGYVWKGVTKAQAKKIDEFTFQKDGGWFIRENHKAKLDAAKSDTVTKPQTEQQQPATQPDKKEQSKDKPFYFDNLFPERQGGKFGGGRLHHYLLTSVSLFNSPNLPNQPQNVTVDDVIRKGIETVVVSPDEKPITDSEMDAGRKIYDYMVEKGEIKPLNQPQPTKQATQPEPSKVDDKYRLNTDLRVSPVFGRETIAGLVHQGGKVRTADGVHWIEKNESTGGYVYKHQDNDGNVSAKGGSNPWSRNEALNSLLERIDYDIEQAKNNEGSTVDFKAVGTVKGAVKAWKAIKTGDVIKNHHGEAIGIAVSSPRGATVTLTGVPNDLTDKKFKFNQVTGNDNQALLKKDDNTPPDDDPTPTPPKGPKKKPQDDPNYGKNNKIFTEDAANKAREILRKKLSGSQLNSGLDPEIVQAGIMLAGYHIESGMRKFADYAKAMVADIGPEAKPFLRSWYEGARYYPGFDAKGMDDAATIDTLDIDSILNEDSSNDSTINPANNNGVPSGRSTVQRNEPDNVQGSDVPTGETSKSDATGTDQPGRELSNSGKRSGKRNATKSEPLDLDTVDGLGQATKAKRISDNVTAIKLMKQLIAENRPATTEEKQTLARYTGWGGLSSVFDELNKSKSERAVDAELQSLLTETEYNNIRASLSTAFYTDKDIVKAMWTGVEAFGLNGAMNIVEPSVGSGNFIGWQPAHLRQSSHWSAAELDTVTGNIARLIYDDANVQVRGFEKTPFKPNSFSLAIGNPPFGLDEIYDNANPDLSGMRVHNYMIGKSAKLLHENGLLMMVVTHRFLDTKNENHKNLSSDLEFVGAVRLPNTAFKHANTKVTTDIVVFRKLKEGEKAKNLSWTNTDGNIDGIRINQYFAENPQNILGRLANDGKTNFSQGLLTVHPTEAHANLGESVAKALTQMAQGVDVSLTDQQKDNLAADVMLTESNLPVGGMMLNADGKVLIRSEDKNGGAVVSEVIPTSVWSDNGRYIMDNLMPLINDQKALREHINNAMSNSAGKLKSTYGAKVFQAFQKYSQLKIGKSALKKEVDAYLARAALGPVNYQKITEMLAMRNTALALLHAERTDAPNIEALRKQLNEQYDAFANNKKFAGTGKNKLQNQRAAIDANKTLLKGDYGIETGLDSVRNGVVSKHAIFDRRMLEPYTPPKAASNIGDGVTYSISERGKIDVPYIAELLGISHTEAHDQLTTGEKPYLLFDPAKSDYVFIDDYLSGNVKQKLAEAEENQLTTNVKLLKEVQPKDKPVDKITPSIRASWMDPIIFENFLAEVGYPRAKVQVIRANGSIRIHNPGNYTPTELSGKFKGVERPITDIFEAAANGKSITITYKDANGSMVKDVEATTRVNLAVNKMAETFKVWATNTPAIRQKIADNFNERVNTHIERTYNGDLYFKPVGQNPNIPLRKTQKDGAVRAIQSKNVLMDHTVGAGKTFTAIAAIMQRRRLGLSKKPMVVVPNHIINSWQADFYKLYPSANILTIKDKDLSPANRKQFFARIATGDYDAIIIGHSHIMRIPNSEKALELTINEKISELRKAKNEAREEVRSNGGRGSSISQIEQAIKSLNDKLAQRKEKAEAQQDATSVDFAALGIDYLTIDEAHEFKNLMYSSSSDRVVGMNSPSGSEKAFDLLVKVRTVQEEISNGGVAFLTGTPISNSLVEIYTMLYYLGYNDLKSNQMSHYDAFAGAFLTTSNEMEYTATGTVKERTVLKGVNAAAELSTKYRQFADIITHEDMLRIYAEDVERKNIEKGENNDTRFPVPNVKGGQRQMNIAPATEAQKLYNDYLIARMAGISQNTSDQDYARIDNPLVVLTDAKKASLDIRLVDPTADRDPTGKISRAADGIKRLYDQWESDKGTQLVFSDMGTPAKNAVKETKGNLVLLAKFLMSEARAKAYVAEQLQQGDLAYEKTFTELLERIDGIELSTKQEEVFNKLVDELKSAVITADTGFSVYDDLKAALIERGIPENEIAFIHDYPQEKKQDLYDSVNAGDIRVLIGSTMKMGAGTNAQERLVGLWHMDCPWRPSDISQREGRIIRQGNKLYERAAKNGTPDDFEVEINVMVTQGSSDPVMWQIQERKARAIEQFRAGALDDFVEKDGDSNSFAEFKAAATGNPIYRLSLEANKQRDIADADYVAAATTVRGAKDVIDNYPADRERYMRAVNDGSDLKLANFDVPNYIKVQDFESRRYRKQFVEYENALSTWEQMSTKERREKKITKPEKPKKLEWFKLDEPYAKAVRDKVYAPLKQFMESGKDGTFRREIDLGDFYSVEVDVIKKLDNNAEVAYYAEINFNHTSNNVAYKTLHGIKTPETIAAALDLNRLISYKERNYNYAVDRLSRLEQQYAAAQKVDTSKADEARAALDAAQAVAGWLEADAKLADMQEDIRRSKQPNIYIDSETVRNVKRSSFDAKGMITDPITINGKEYLPVGAVIPLKGEAFSRTPAIGPDGEQVHIKTDKSIENHQVRYSHIGIIEKPDSVIDTNYKAIRDQVISEVEDLERPAFMRQPPMVAQRAKYQDIVRAVDRWTSEVKGAGVKVVVHRTTNDYINAQRLIFDSEIGDSEINAPAFIDPKTKTIHIAATNVASVADIPAILRHEVLAHYGTRAVLGTKGTTEVLTAMRQSLQKLIQSDPDMKSAWAMVVSGYGFDSNQWLNEMDELLAHYIHHLDPDTLKGKAKIMWQRIFGMIKRHLRQRGWLLKQGEISKEELVYIVYDIIKPRLKRGELAPNEEKKAVANNRDLDIPAFVRAADLKKNARNSTYALGKMSQRGVMSALTIRQLAESFGDIFGQNMAKDYQRALNKMEASRIEQVKKAEPINELWDNLDRDQSVAVSDLMNDATMYQIHADIPLEEQPQYTDLEYKLENAQLRLDRSLRRSHLDAVADNQAKVDKLTKEMNTMKENYRDLSTRYNALPKAAKDIYQAERRYFRNAWRDLEDAMNVAINKSEFASDTERDRRIEAVNKKFRAALRYGPYFPLKRFGEYVYVGKNADGEYVREHFATALERDEAMRVAENDGYDVRPTVVSEATLHDLDPSSMGYELMRSLNEMKGTADSADAVLDSVIDAINQSVLRMMPGHSNATRSIHRKNIRGASNDGRRAFADTAYHFALNYGKVLHGIDMENELTRMRKAIDQSKKPGEQQIISNDHMDTAVRLYDELVKRHKETLNPTGSPLASKFTAAGFVLYLGGSIGAGLINFTQTLTVALPQLAAKYGYKQTANELFKAMKEIGQSEFAPSSREAWLSLTRNPNLSADEKALFESLFEAGVLDTTQSHALAMMSDTDAKSVTKASIAKEKALRYISAIFHNVEVVNREATALAAYRLMKSKNPQLKMDDDTVTKVADAVYNGHFDYASSNRPWLMRSSNFMRVATQFKLYSQHMTYLIVTGANAAIKDIASQMKGVERDEAMRIAAKEFYGILGAHFAAAGMLGLPMVSTILMGLTAMFDDEDDPWNAELALKNGMASVIGTDAANLLLKGVGQPLGLDLHNRISLGSLWYREPMINLEGRDYGYYVLSQLAGPVLGGTLVNGFQGLHEISEGEVMRGASRIVPKFVRDMGKAVDQSMNGVTDYSGNEIVKREDLSWWDLGWQAMGITPAKISRAYEARSDIKSYRTAINSRRTDLIGKLASALQNGEDIDDIMAEIGAFNAINPRKAITQKSLRSSLRNRIRNQALNEGGVSLSDSDSYMREQGAWAR